MAYRLTMNNKPDNQDASRLGDRTLALFMHPNENYYPATYHYANMNMGGDANRWTNVPHNSQNRNWHFIYFGYSKANKQAYFVHLIPGQPPGVYNIPNTNHYFTEKFWFAVRDARYPTWSGQISNLVVNLGAGAFKQSDKDYNAPGDVFNFALGFNPRVPQPKSGGGVPAAVVLAETEDTQQNE
jgi:hypothetical protein